jgi:hypothetical protein
VTLWAHRDGNRIAVACTSGSLEVKVREDPGHLRYFWHELGRQLDELEHEQHHAKADAQRAEAERSRTVAQCAPGPEDQPDGT